MARAMPKLIKEKTRLTVKTQNSLAINSDPSQPAERLVNQAENTLNQYGFKLRKKDIGIIIVV